MTATNTAKLYDTNWFGSPNGQFPPPDSDAAHHAVAHLNAANVMLPSQFRQGREWRPEELLCLAVLEQAIDDLRRGGFVSRNECNAGFLTGEARRNAVEAAEWFASRDAEPVHSFVAVCSTLGLDPAAVRKAVGR
jgi:hypothetical protein